MTMLVSLQQASDHLRRDTSDDDNDLTLKIEAASAAVIEYIRGGADSFTDSAGDVFIDSNGDPLYIPHNIKAATLLLIGDFYAHRGAESPAWTEPGFLPAPIRALLTPYRDPSLA